MHQETCNWHLLTFVFSLQVQSCARHHIECLGSSSCDTTEKASRKVRFKLFSGSSQVVILQVARNYFEEISIE